MKPVALITGGQRGIGFGIARALAAEGYRVAIAAEAPADDKAVALALDALDGQAAYFEHDLRNIEAAARLVERVEAEIGPVSSFVSNAGVPARKRGDLLDVTVESFDRVMDVNLRGAFFLAREVGRRMVDRPVEPYRSMVFVTSVSASMVSTERAEYCISKAGASMMAQLFAARLAAEGIGVFELRPGIIDTDMTAGVRDRYTARIADGLVPAGRWGEARDIADIIVPLVTGRMAFATGAAIPVDGGLSIHRL